MFKIYKEKNEKFSWGLIDEKSALLQLVTWPQAIKTWTNEDQVWPDTHCIHSRPQNPGSKTYHNQE